MTEHLTIIRYGHRCELCSSSTADTLGRVTLWPQPGSISSVLALEAALTMQTCWEIHLQPIYDNDDVTYRSAAGLTGL